MKLSTDFPLGLRCCLLLEEHVVTDCTDKVGFWYNQFHEGPLFPHPWHCSFGIDGWIWVYKADGASPARPAEDHQRAVLATGCKPHNGFYLLLYARRSLPSLPFLRVIHEETYTSGLYVHVHRIANRRRSCLGNS